jgi:hypothetical protein
MDRKYAYYVFLGLLIGAVFGAFWRVPGNASLSLLYGALAGAGLGWFIAAYRSQSQKENDKTGRR